MLSGLFSSNKCPYIRKQADEAAKWWLKTLTTEIPDLISKRSRNKIQKIDLNETQIKFFISELSVMIWEKCQLSEFQKDKAFVTLEYRGENGDLIEEALSKIKLTIKDNMQIYDSFATHVLQNGRVEYVYNTRLNYDSDEEKNDSDYSMIFSR